MKPLHASFVRLSKCPCCQTKYSANGVHKMKIGKKAARAKTNIETRKMVSE
jgi:hypothetical protein